MSLGKNIQVRIVLNFSPEHNGIKEEANVVTNDVPTSLVIESLRNLTKGLAEILIKEASEEVPVDGYEAYLDGRIKADRIILENLLKS